MFWLITYSIALYKSWRQLARAISTKYIHGVLMRKSWASLFVCPISHSFVMLIAMRVTSTREDRATSSYGCC
jgi:hypothetical protein